MFLINYGKTSYVTLLQPTDVPNAGRKLVTLPKRMEWDKEFLKFINDLNSKKPVVICGDMNVAHQEIGINPIVLASLNKKPKFNLIS